MHLTRMQKRTAKNINVIEVIISIAGLILTEALPEIKETITRESNSKRPSKVALNVGDNIYVRCVVEAFEYSDSKLTLDFPKIVKILTDALKPKWVLTEFKDTSSYTQNTISYSQIANQFDTLKLSKSGGVIVKFLKSVKSRSVPVKVRERVPVTKYPSNMPEWGKTYR